MSHSAGVIPKSQWAHADERTCYLLSFAKAFRKVPRHLRNPPEVTVGDNRVFLQLCIVAGAPKGGRERQMAKLADNDSYS